MIARILSLIVAAYCLTGCVDLEKFNQHMTAINRILADVDSKQHAQQRSKPQTTSASARAVIIVQQHTTQNTPNYSSNNSGGTYYSQPENTSSSSGHYYAVPAPSIVAQSETPVSHSTSPVPAEQYNQDSNSSKDEYQSAVPLTHTTSYYQESSNSSKDEPQSITQSTSYYQESSNSSKDEPQSAMEVPMQPVKYPSDNTQYNSGNSAKENDSGGAGENMGS